MDAEALKRHLTPAQRTQAARDIEAAADLLERVGWTQGRNLDFETGAVCASWAIHQVTGCDGMHGCAELDSRMNLAVTAMSKYLGSLVMVWNDTQGRSMGEVLTTMRLCAGWLDKLAKEA